MIKIKQTICLIALFLLTVPSLAKTTPITYVTEGLIEITENNVYVDKRGRTRGELATWLVKATEITPPNITKDLFSDVPKDHILAPYIKIATDLKLFKPFADGTFRPKAIVSRAKEKEIFEQIGASI